MQKQLNILFLGVKSTAANMLETHLDGRLTFNVRSSYTSGSGAKVNWSEIDGREKPEIIILSVDDQWNTMLPSIPESIHRNDQALVVIGPESDGQASRMAMKMGARDYLSEPIAVEEVTDSLLQISSRFIQPAKKEKGKVVSVINAKGGSGGSFIATNVAHVFTDVENMQTALLDFDFQYGVQSLSLDVPIEHDLAEVLAMAPKLDPESMKGYFSKHKSGIRLLAERHENIVLTNDINLSNISSLIENVEKGYDQVVVDLPRQVDPIFSTVVSHSHNILIVMQQTIAHVRDAKRLFSILVDELDITSDRIMLIVNRYDKDSSLSLDAIKETVGCNNIFTLVNDYKRVAMVTDMAMPLFSYAPNAPLTGELISLCHQVSGIEKDDKKSLLNKVLGGFLSR